MSSTGRSFMTTSLAGGVMGQAVKKSGRRSRKDTPDFIRTLEGPKLAESFEHPQGAKPIRAQDRKAMIDFRMSRIENGEIRG